MHLSGLQEVFELKNVPGRQLVTAQCFTNALIQLQTHLHRHSHNNGQRAKGQHVAVGLI